MKKNQIIALVTAVLVFLVLALNPLGSGKAKGEEKLVKVVTAKETIFPQKQITEDMLQIKEINQGSLNEMAFQTIEDVVGNVTLSTIYGGDVFTYEKIANKDSAAAGISVNIPDGMRAISMDVEMSTGMSGLIKIGNRVDITGVIDGTDRKAVLILQNKKVIALDKTMVSTSVEKPDEKQYITITLAVSPEEALRLTLSTQMGPNRAILRNEKDQGLITHQGISAEELLNNPTGGNNGN